MTLKKIEPEQVRSLSIVRRLMPWREQLATAFGTGHGNASLQTIDVLIVLLAAFFNPMVRSQRLIEALSSQAWMQAQTGLARVPRSTLSDAVRRFDPSSLEPLIRDLTARIPALRRRNPDLEAITRQVLIADGTHFNLAGEVAWALQCRRGRSEKPQARVRWNVQLDLEHFVPVDGDLSGGDDGSEPDALRRRLRGDVVYVMDRNFLHFALLNDILNAGSSFVLRLRKNTCFAADSARALTAKDRDLGVLADEEGRLTGGKTHVRHYSAAPPARTLRRVTVWDAKNQTRLVLLTDMFDVPAWVIAELYRGRWQIELFFKWVKSYAAMDCLLSQHPNGITLQFYIAVIATLLMYLATGRPVDKYTMFWLSSVANGQATWEEARAGLARIQREKELARARYQRKRLAAKSNL